MNRKFLLPTDGSDNAHLAVNTMMDLASTDDKIFVLNVVPDILTGNLIDKFDPEGFYREFSKNADRILKSVIDNLNEKGFHTEGLVSRGKPGEIICEESEDHDVDYIVLGRRGKGATSEFLLGSVSQYVIHHTEIPVIVTGPEE